jgi:DNA polymerase III sliding clamp (beta) subunit (PCNA family)
MPSVTAKPSNQLLNTLKFVQGGVSKKTFIPELTHFCIEDSTIRSFNGSLALNSPIALDINCKPKAAPFVQAIRKCTETVTMTMTPTGKLSVKSGAFKALIDCIDGETPHVTPSGERFDFDGLSLLSTLKTLAPFVCDTASKPWSGGVLFSGQSAFATNNVMIVEVWMGSSFPVNCNIPLKTVKEILRIGEPPTHGIMDDMSVTFFYEDGRWVRSNLLSVQWPDVATMMNIQCNPVAIRKDLFLGLHALKDLTDEYGRVFIRNNLITTAMYDGEGASYQLPDLDYEGGYRLDSLLSLENLASTADFSFYPKPIPFFGDKIRGILIGLRT